MDTDSLYSAFAMEVDVDRLNDLAYHPLESMIKPHLLEQWRSLIWSRANCDSINNAVWTPDYDRHFEPRRCCKDCHMWDQKTPFLFKLEAVGTKMTALSSKTYCMVTTDGKTKFATKGVQGKAIHGSRLVGEDQHTHVYDKMKLALETKTCGEPVTNKSFRMDRSYKTLDYAVMTTVGVTKSPYNVVYTKRVVQANGVDTVPLPTVLRPTKRRADPIGYDPNDNLQVDPDEPQQLPQVLRQGGVEVMQIDLEDDRDRVLGEDYPHLREAEGRGDDVDIDD
jgi:hypothetical protein